MPTISVIVPIYKVEEYLARCVDSILAQTFTDYELFLVDDGSPDNCGAMCDEYAKKDPRITVIHKQNGGLSDARNAALEVASGEYIAFIDSDDWVAPNHLESMLAALKEHGADMAVCNFPKVHEDGRKEPMYHPANELTVREGDEVFETLNQPAACNKLYKASIFKTLRYPVGKLYEDVFVYTAVLEQVKRLVYTGEDTYYYFLRQGSIMRTDYTPRFMDIVEACYLRAESLEKLGQPTLANEARMFVYSQAGVAYAHVDRKDAAAVARLCEVREMFEKCYPSLMADRTISKMQKLRIRLLKICPWLHTQLFGKRMPINLGG